MNDKLSAFYGQFDPAAPDVYYNNARNQYLIQQTGDPLERDWIAVPKFDMIEILQERGISAQKAKGEDVSPAEKFIGEVRNNTLKKVDFASPLAGYPAGFHRINGINVLVTTGPKIPKAIRGEWGLIKSTIDQLFGDQAVYIYSYLKLSRWQLINMDMRGMPAIIMIGPRNCGKSFFQTHIMTPVLGGRGANVTRNLTGEESFNGLIYQNEHLIIGDGPLSTATRDRRKLGNYIKELVGTEEQTMRVMRTDPLPISSFRRLSISFNDEQENINQLPVLDKSMLDKLFLFRVKKVRWPVVAVTPEEVIAFRHSVEAQIPAFCWWLDNEFSVPEELTREQNGDVARFGLRHYHDPSIVGALVEMSPEFTLAEYIKLCFFTPPATGLSSPATYAATGSIQLTAVDMAAALTGDNSPVRYNARELLSSGARLPTLLERLHSKYPSCVFQRRTAKNRFWVVQDIDTILSSVVYSGEGGEENGGD